MNNKRDDFKKFNEYKYEMLEAYNHLQVDYEYSKELNEEVVAKYKTQASIVQCSQIVAYNSEPTVLHWCIELLDGTKVYETGNYILYHAMTLNLNNLSIVPNTQFKLTATSADGDKYSTAVMQYIPNSITVYYEFISYNYNYIVSYITMIASPLSPPILKCSSLSILNSAVVLTKYELRSAENNTTIYTSNRYCNGKRWSKNLSDLSILPGTNLKLHAGVIAGKDSEPYVILKYDPTVPINSDTANFSLEGTTSHTTIYYKGLN